MTDKYRVHRIVLIDDSAEDRARFRGALLRGAPDRRYLFREADNGVDGLALCQPDDEWPIDCIVTDVQMPRMTGLDILRHLKIAGEDFLPVPVIVLTGTNDENEEASQALKLGAQDYITKNGMHHTTLFRSIDNAIDRHAMLKKLRESERAAEAANRAKSALIGNISHEIRTPMTAVLGLCEVLLGEDLPPQHRPLLKMIRDNGAYLVEIVNDLLDLSKIEAGMLQIEAEPVDFPGFLQDLIQLMKVRAQENETELLLNTAEIPNAIEIDAVRLRQILLNLLSNAIKFSPNGKVELTVRVAAAAVRPALIFTVTDSGCGIPEKDLEAIFHPFIQSADSAKRRSSGTGLGLSICRRLCEAMNGSVSVVSQVGEGSTFTVELPLKVATATLPEPEAQPTLSRPALSRPVEELLSGCRVLVAEDTRATQLLIRHFIEKGGGEVTIVDDGKKLVQCLIESPDKFDVILSDVQMPELSGLEATKQIRENGLNIPIIVLTADALQETREVALANGASDVVTKPIQRDVLLNRIALHREQSMQTRQ